MKRLVFLLTLCGCGGTAIVDGENELPPSDNPGTNICSGPLKQLTEVTVGLSVAITTMTDQLTNACVTIGNIIGTSLPTSGGLTATCDPLIDPLAEALAASPTGLEWGGVSCPPGDRSLCDDECGGDPRCGDICTAMSFVWNDCDAPFVMATGPDEALADILALRLPDAVRVERRVPLLRERVAPAVTALASLTPSEQVCIDLHADVTGAFEVLVPALDEPLAVAQSILSATAL